MKLQVKGEYKRTVGGIDDPLVIISTVAGKTITDCINDFFERSKTVTKGYKFYMLTVIQYYD